MPPTDPTPASAAAPVVRARGLVKRYKDVTAVNGLDLEVTRGTCLGLLGPNGAGKTTTIEMLEGLKQPDEGEIEVLGLNWSNAAQEIRSRIGVQLQETRLFEKLSVLETLDMFASFYPEVRPLQECLEEVGLWEKRDAKIEGLSGGQHQRLTLACSLVSHPEVLFLDEPTTGLDPQARRRVWEIVEAFKERGGTVLLTTHYMEEAERLSDEVAIVDSGKVITRGTPAAVIDSLDAESIVELMPYEGDTSVFDTDALGALPTVGEVRTDIDRMCLSVTDTQKSLSEILAHLSEKGLELEGLTTHRPTLEDVFVSLTGKHLRDA